MTLTVFWIVVQRCSRELANCQATNLSSIHWFGGKTCSTETKKDSLPSKRESRKENKWASWSWHHWEGFRSNNMGEPSGVCSQNQTKMMYGFVWIRGMLMGTYKGKSYQSQQWMRCCRNWTGAQFSQNLIWTWASIKLSWKKVLGISQPIRLVIRCFATRGWALVLTAPQNSTRTLLDKQSLGALEPPTSLMTSWCMERQPTTMTETFLRC